jgi:uncharacterized damage-inducible protein DinB
MTCSTAESLIQSFALTHRLIKMQTDGLTNADSLLQLPFRGNCLNWVLGHILVDRNRVLKRLGESPVWDESEIARYKQGSEPIVSAEQALPLEKLLDDLDQSQQRIAAALAKISPEELAATVDAGGDKSLGQALAGSHWHETYHTGQLEILRQLAGTDDVIIK